MKIREIGRGRIFVLEYKNDFQIIKNDGFFL